MGIWRLVAAVAVVAALAAGGLLIRTKGEVGRLRSEVEALRRAAGAGPERQALVNPAYSPAVAGAEGWTYHKTASADLDGDGAEEQVHVITNPAWNPQTGEFGWNDGHPWHVYVEEPDGTRTYLWSNWVQMGRLDVMISADAKPELLILLRSGTGVGAWRVTYRGPQQAEAVQALEFPVMGTAHFTDPLKYRDP